MTDIELLKISQEVIKKSYVKKIVNVSCAILSKSGQVYTGVNVHGISNHVCAEMSALTQAYLNNDYDLALIVATHYNGGEPCVLNPCGNCRQILVNHCPDIQVIIQTRTDGLKKYGINNLIPDAMENPYSMVRFSFLTAPAKPYSTANCFRRTASIP